MHPKFPAKPHVPGLSRVTTAFNARYLDVLASVYLYNEHRGYTSLDRVLAAVKARCPDNPAFIAEIAHHRADEEKHYRMFRRWFELRGQMPLAVDRAYGHIDAFIARAFGCDIDALDTHRIVGTPGEFERLCRVIMLTEQRGLRQVEVLLASPIIRADRALHRIFQVIHKDEPSHFLPYKHWLEANGGVAASWRERLSDWTIHKALMLWKLPALFVKARAPRLAEWPDVLDVKILEEKGKQVALAP